MSPVPTRRKSSESDVGIHELRAQIAVLQERYDQLIRAKEEEKEILEEIREELSDIHDMANRWKGGFVVVVALGALVGWVLSNLESFLKLIGKSG